MEKDEKTTSGEMPNEQEPEQFPQVSSEETEASKPTPAIDETGVIAVEMTLDAKVNFAKQQNAVASIQDLRIENTSEKTLEAIRILLTTDPEYAPLWEYKLDSLPAKRAHRIETILLDFSPTKLAQLNERISGHLTLQIESGGKRIHTESHPIEYLAFNQWSGFQDLPELLAAFVQPNHPAVMRILQKGKDALAKNGQGQSFSGYQTENPEQVYWMVRAIYEGMQSFGISYINPPKSFEETGQKIRLPDALLTEKMGTCLDIAVVVSAAIEQAGLYPAILFIPGHAFLGVWLSETPLPYTFLDGAMEIRKLAELDQLLIFDSSAMVGDVPQSFEQARVIAAEHLRENDEAMLVDIQAAREQRIRPLPTRNENELTLHPPKPSNTPQPSEQNLEEAAHVYRPQEDARPIDESPEDRLSRWKTKLLDLSLRNRLLNFKTTKATIHLLVDDISLLEDDISSQKGFTLLEKPELMNEGQGRSLKHHKAQTGEDALFEFLKSERKRGRFHTNHTSDELQNRGRELYRKAKHSLEESGANMLHLALGFVRWRETPRSEKSYLAPILLLPVTLSRKSVTDPFTLSLADSEPRINTTFLKKMEVEYGIKETKLAHLPEDEHGLDIPLILRRWREAVLALKGWEVITEAHLGLFSFTKYMMWLDMNERTAELKENQVVEHLLERFDKPFGAESGFASAGQLEKELEAEETFCVLDADSSQLAGVFAADNEKSFVMEGPPGTGKSQTITNIIAQLLAKGKTVLFVSEKRAALEVVYRRLADVGLKDFCLELHSNKTNSKEVIRQLGESLHAGPQRPSQDWNKLCARLDKTREALNGYIDAAYKKREFGKSFRDAIVILIGLREVKSLPLQFPDDFQLDESLKDRMDEYAASLEVAAEALLAEPSSHAFNAVGLTSWNPSMMKEVERLTEALRLATVEVEEAEQEAKETLRLSDAAASRETLKRLDALASVIADAPGHSAALLSDENWLVTKKRLEEVAEHGANYHEAKSVIESHYDFERFAALDFETLLPRFEKWALAFFLLSWILLFFPKRQVKATMQKGRARSVKEMLGDLKLGKKALAEQKTITQKEEFLHNTIGVIYEGVNTDWPEVTKLISWIAQARRQLDWWESEAEENTQTLRERFIELCGEKHETLVKQGSAGKTLGRFQKALASFEEARQPLTDALMLDENQAYAKPHVAGYLLAVLARIEAWQAHPSHLEYWVRYREAGERLGEIFLLPIFHAHKNGDIETGEIMHVYRRSLYEWWVDSLYQTDKTLAEFYSPSYEATIEKFRKLDEETFAVARDIVHAKLAERVPHVAHAPDSSEVGIIKRELAKQRRHKHIRPLLESLPSLLFTLKPCFLMSPLSVAQYLGKDIPKFDLVIFDEASQIPPWDSIGAIGRGKQVIVVGDSKQLPPTSFFQQSGDDEAMESELLVEDMESILSECVASNLPRHWLRWHYRSRHEHLIAFSNHHYYQNRLLTFPASVADNVRLGVQWRHVEEGVYDHGKSRTNKGEAEAVVAEVVRRLNDPSENHRTIGIVTFSQAQQSLVEDLLEQARAEHPEIEPYFSDDLYEPVFVKNLENVQGDERDVIIFSICYGPDKSGFVRMNFGPLNKRGGERRLNVAITRAREQLVVFSTLKPEMIDLSRTKATGVAHLKTFLAYADRGPTVIQEAVTQGSIGDFDSPFEEDIFQSLSDLGYVAHSQVGCSGFRIDLGVVDEENPGEYLLGIEADGATYHSSKSARDRDRLRQQVLERLGWIIHRIWSTDWFRDKPREIEKLKRAIEDAKRKKAMEEKKRLKLQSEKLPQQMKKLTDSPIKGAPLEAITPTKETEPPPLLPGQTMYEPFSLPVASGDFYDSQSMEIIKNQSLKIIEALAPISAESLQTAIREAWGFSRGGRRISERIETAMAELPLDKQPDLLDGFYWSQERPRGDYEIFRTPKPGEEPTRAIDEIAPEELKNAMAALIEQYGEMTTDDLARATGKLFGFPKLTSKVKMTTARALALLEKAGVAALSDGRVTPLK